MKKGFFAIIVLAAACVTGCVSTVTEDKTAGVKLSADRVENRYQVPLARAFDASKRALASYGQVSRESTLLESTNQIRALEGKANGRDVWIRVEAVELSVTAVTAGAIHMVRE
ncbi:MAG: hypothetical protein U1F83_02250 [Verrucomicrobiota bacterium]